MTRLGSGIPCATICGETGADNKARIKTAVFDPDVIHRFGHLLDPRAKEAGRSLVFIIALSVNRRSSVWRKRHGRSGRTCNQVVRGPLPSEVEGETESRRIGQVVGSYRGPRRSGRSGPSLELLDPWGFVTHKARHCSGPRSAPPVNGFRK